LLFLYPDFLAIDWNVSICCDAYPNLVTTNLNHLNCNAIIDDDSLRWSSAQYKHPFSPVDDVNLYPNY